MNIKSGMAVRVISGNHKGLEGKVLNAFPKKNRVIIEGVNLIKKTTRPTQANPNGGIIEKEASIHVSNVMLLNNGEATKIGYKILKDGSKVRISKRTKEEINI